MLLSNYSVALILCPYNVPAACLSLLESGEERMRKKQIASTIDLYLDCSTNFLQMLHIATLYIVLLIFSLCVSPQVGGSSARQRSRVGCLLPISTPTVAHGMTWSWVPLKLEKVSQANSPASAHTHTHTHTHSNTTSHTLLRTHTQIPPLPSIPSL